MEWESGERLGYYEARPNREFHRVRLSKRHTVSCKTEISESSDKMNLERREVAVSSMSDTGEGGEACFSIVATL